MPMSGIKVVEACSNIAGPVTGTIFGDLGAEVIKIEKPKGGDDARGRHAQRLEYPLLQKIAVEFARHFVDENSQREIA